MIYFSSLISEKNCDLLCDHVLGKVAYQWTLIEACNYNQICDKTQIIIFFLDISICRILQVIHLLSHCIHKEFQVAKTRFPYHYRAPPTKGLFTWAKRLLCFRAGDNLSHVWLDVVPTITRGGTRKQRVALRIRCRSPPLFLVWSVGFLHFCTARCH